MKSLLAFIAMLATSSSLTALPIDAVRKGPVIASCGVSYPDEDQHSVDISWDPKTYTYCGVEATELNKTEGADWWWSRTHSDVITMTVKCRSGNLVTKWGSWTEVHFSVILIPAGRYTEAEATDKGCRVPAVSDACICTNDDKKKVKDCFRSGGNCLHLIEYEFFRCEAMPAHDCEDADISRECGGGAVLHVPDSPFCSY